MRLQSTSVFSHEQVLDISTFSKMDSQQNLNIKLMLQTPHLLLNSFGNDMWLFDVACRILTFYFREIESLVTFVLILPEPSPLVSLPPDFDIVVGVKLLAITLLSVKL